MELSSGPKGTCQEICGIKTVREAIAKMKHSKRNVGKRTMDHVWELVRYCSNGGTALWVGLFKSVRTR